MDIIDSCRRILDEKLKEFEECSNQTQCEGSETSHNHEHDSESVQTQANETQRDEFQGVENDRNLNKILNQQAYLKRMIDQDNHIQLLSSALKTIALEIEELRKSCTKMNEDAFQSRQDLITTHSKEVERFQMGQIRSISEDYNRHQQLLEQRKNEIKNLKKEIEREERDREAYLLDVEKKLEQQLRDRQRALRGGGLPFGLSTSDSTSIDDELRNPNHLELTSVDEYAPYGAAPHSRMPTTARGGRARGGRGSRGRRGRRVA